MLLPHGNVRAWSVAVIVQTLALAWYLPLLLLTIFRPNLEDRVAAAVVK